MADLIPDSDTVLYVDGHDFSCSSSVATLTMYLIPAIPGNWNRPQRSERVTHLLVPAQQYASARVPQPDTAIPY